MALAVTHFAVGAGVMLLLQPMLFPSIRSPRTLVVASGLWSLAPDIHYVVPFLDNALNHGPLAIVGNLFWFHTYLDARVQGRGTRRNAALALVFLALCAVLADVYQRTHTDQSVVDDQTDPAGRSS